MIGRLEAAPLLVASTSHHGSELAGASGHDSAVEMLPGVGDRVGGDVPARQEVLDEGTDGQGKTMVPMPKVPPRISRG